MLINFNPERLPRKKIKILYFLLSILFYGTIPCNAKGIMTMSHILDFMENKYHDNSLLYKRLYKENPYQLVDKSGKLKMTTDLRSAPYSSADSYFLDSKIDEDTLTYYRKTPGNLSLTAAIILTGIAKGSFFYSDFISNVDNEIVGIYGPLIYLPPLAYILSGLITRKLYDYKPIRTQDANIYLFGNMMGAIHGDMLYSIFFDHRPGDVIKGYPSFIAFSMMAEGWASYFYSKGRKFTHDQTMGWSFGNIWGTLFGRGLSRITLGNIERHDKRVPYFQLGAAAGGMLLGSYITHKIPISKDGFYIANTLGGISSLFSVAALYNVQDFRNREILRFLMVGGTLGLSYYLLKDTHINKGDGSFFMGGAIVGGLFSFLVRGMPGSEGLNKNSSRKYLLPGIISTVFGGAAVACNYALKGMRVITAHKIDKKRFHYNINPMGLAMVNLNQSQQANLLQMNMDVSVFNLKIDLN